MTAFVDTVPSRARTLAREFGLSVRIATGLQEVLGEIDGALIATPNHTHRDLAVACLRAGVHVLIEKPITTSASEAEDIVRAAEEGGAVAAVGYATRFRENVRLMKALLEEGYFGTVRRWVYQFGSRGGWEPMSAYHMDRKASGGGVLVVTGSHFVDRMLHWFGYPTGYDFRDDSAGGPEANAVARLRFDGDIEGLVRLSKTYVLKAGFAMETDRGHVVLADSDTAPILLRPADHPRLQLEIRRREVTAGGPGTFQLQIEDFVDAARQGRPPEIPARQGLLSTRLMEELYACRRPLDWEFYPASGAAGR